MDCRKCHFCYLVEDNRSLLSMFDFRVCKISLKVIFTVVIQREKDHATFLFRDISGNPMLSDRKFTPLKSLCQVLEDLVVFSNTNKKIENLPTFPKCSICPESDIMSESSSSKYSN